MVPDDLIGLTEDEARQKLADAGLRVQVTRREDATMAPGTVMRPIPGPGSDVDVNSVVRHRRGHGAPTVTASVVTGRRRQRADPGQTLV